MNDPYTDTDLCVNRLLREHSKHPRLIVACDFDDTVFPYHGGSSTHERVIRLLQRCSARDFHIVVFTASSPDRYPFMQTYLSERGIKVSSVNTNPISLPFGNHGKVYYNILLDDRAGLGQACDVLEGLMDRLDRSA